MRIDWIRLVVWTVALAFCLVAWAILIWALGTMAGELG